MLKNSCKTVLAALTVAGAVPMTSAALAQDKPKAAEAEHYSVSTTKVGTLIDDPAAAEVLQRQIPAIWANDMFQSMGRDQTLQAIQQFEPSLTAEKLAEIQAELDKLPVKK